MFEWTNVTETCSYIQAPAKIGIVETGDRKVVLIDSGNDKDAGRKIHRMLRDRGLTLTAIYNTHSHADHIGGNQFLQSQYDCRIFAPEEELSFVLHPHLEPSFLYGGSKNCAENFLSHGKAVRKRFATRSCRQCFRPSLFPVTPSEWRGFAPRTTLFF